jgi:tripartite-type tricarboxylate transporter receptor subunit TctC
VKANPGQNFGSAGIGTSNHLTGELIGLRYGIKLVHVPYKGAAPVHADLMGGHIPMTIDQVTTAAKLAGDGKVKALAVTTAKRSPLLPNVPTFAESGAPGFDLASWQGLFGPAGLPPAVVAALYDAALHALQDPAVKQSLATFGSDPGGQKPAEFAAFVIREKDKWGAIVRDANVKP